MDFGLDKSAREKLIEGITTKLANIYINFVTKNTELDDEEEYK